MPCLLTVPPAMTSFHNEIFPSFDLKRSLTVSLAVSLMAFSGDTPTNWGRSPTKDGEQDLLYERIGQSLNKHINKYYHWELG